MRPPILNPLFASATGLPGVGPRIAKLIQKVAGGPHVVDLLWRLPTGIIDRRFAPKVAEAPEGRIATITVMVDSHERPRNPRLPYKVHTYDDTGPLDLVFFRAHEDYLKRSLPPGETRVVSGKVEIYNGLAQMTHPDRIVTAAELATLKAVEPVYPLTTGLTLKPLGKIMRAALDRAIALPEWDDPAWLKARGWTSWLEAVRTAHAPESEADLAPGTSARWCGRTSAPRPGTG